MAKRLVLWLSEIECRAGSRTAAVDWFTIAGEAPLPVEDWFTSARSEAEPAMLPVKS
jgi:hypothetical protein